MMDAASPLASLEGVVASFGGRAVLDHVSLSLDRGEFWGLIGPNGAGKSTLLGAFNGMTRCEKGVIRFQGQAVSGRAIRRLRLSIAHVFQMIDIDPKTPATVWDAVLSGVYGRLGLFRKPGRDERRLVEESIAQVGLAGFEGRPLGQLSGGERQKVALARALAQKPELLLLDEPTAALDWRAQREILELARRIQREMKLTILMATHDLNAASHIVDQVAMLKEGRMIWRGRVEEAMDGALLSRLYGAEVEIATHQGRKVALF